MEISNTTSMHNFTLLGLSNFIHLKFFYFAIILLIYQVALLGNTLLFTVVMVTPRLHSPMYFFLIQLSFVDMGLSSSVVPKILTNTLSKEKSISFLGCAAQLYFSSVFGETEALLLSIMSYDRYAAICHPLHYTTIMNRKLCIYLVVGSWVSCLSLLIVHTFLTFQLPFCKSHHVNHYFCEMPALLRLSCKDTWMNEMLMYISAGILALAAFLLILISYIRILLEILKIKSSMGRRNTFSTCLSDITVLTLFYGNISLNYMCPNSSYSPDRQKVLSLLYMAVTPMLNPIVYSLKNREYLDSLRGWVARFKLSQEHF
ncbi:olfactory receptor 5G3-like [Xenopus laevis]|uniref:Olfactory receptor n=2 Tax=Xenopus laevis TaxID=8355 RepID=A0A1L8FBY3_XENLA|nr:olfactory receptor 5G3-like [Xenopus laevis]OCT69109.1 hypothetical protein XELAEV_18040418mg [Xenopus laevis]